MSTLRDNLHIAPQEIYTSASTQATDLGALATTGDGRYFRYALAGGVTLVPGKLQQGPAQDTTNYNPSGGLAVAAAAINTTSITLTGSLTITANALAGAIMTVAITPGQGYSYRVKGNTAVSGAANCVVTLEDPLQVALTTSSKVVFVVNQFNSVIVNPTTATGTPVGVPMFAVVNAQYGWIQVYGLCGILSDGGTTVGLGLAPSAAVAGAAKTMAATLCQVGYAASTLTDTQYGVAVLNLE